MAQKKIEIPQDLNTEYVLPEGASAEDLRGLAEVARDQAVAAIDTNTDEGYAQAVWLSTVVDQLGDAATTQEGEVAERQRVRDELRTKLAPAEDAADGPEDEEDDDAEGGDGTETPAAPELAAVPEPVAVLASAPSVAAIAKAAPKPKVTKRRNTVRSLVAAAADVPGYASGAEVSIDQIGSMFISRSRGFLNRKAPGRIQAGFAQVRLDAEPALTASAQGGSADITEQLNRAADERNLPNGNLTAAGGWCAPSTVLYDLLNVSTSEGLIDLPEVSAPRGGLKWATGPDFGTVYGSSGFFTQTEAQAEAGDDKPVFNVACPEFTEDRMDADGAYFTGDILTRAAYPESITDFIQKAMIAFDHRTSYKSIADMVAGSTAVDLSSTTAPQVNLGALSTILDGILLQIEDMKYRNRLSRGQSVEVVLPYFARGILRSDLTKRQGLDANQIKMADAEIDEMFNDAGAKVQYVYDWQENIAQGGTANAFGSASSPATTWPQTFKSLIYANGTWARALEPVIDLSTVYDSALLTNNEYVALFLERGRLVIKRGFDSRVVTLDSVPSGLTSGFVAVTSPAGAYPL